jgi:two-component system response regulator PilR (NtrC family)
LSEGGDLRVDVLGDLTLPMPEENLRQAAVAPPPPGEVVDAAAPIVIPSDLQSHLDRQEREILVQTLHETGFNRTAAAARLGLSLRQIRYRIARLKIDVPADRDAVDDAD